LPSDGTAAIHKNFSFKREALLAIASFKS
jgi:hypothetical protein